MTTRHQRRSSLLALLAAALLFHLRPIPAASAYPPRTNTDFIRTSCGATLYPDLCYTSLSGYANAVQKDPARLARVAVGVSLTRARRMVAYLYNVSRQADYGGQPRAAAALHDCSDVFGDAVDQIHDSMRQMRHLSLGGGETVRFQMSNVQTWMSAALTNEDTCTDGFEDVPEGSLKSDVSNRVVKVKEVTSNALALVNSYASSITTP